MSRIVQGKATTLKQYQSATADRLKRQESKRAPNSLKVEHQKLCEAMSEADQLSMALALSQLKEEKEEKEEEEKEEEDDVYQFGEDWWDLYCSEEEFHQLMQEILKAEEADQVEQDRLLALKLLGQI